MQDQFVLRLATVWAFAFLVWAGGCGSSPAADLDRSLAAIQERRANARRLNAEALRTENLLSQQQLLEQAVRLDDLYGEAHHNLGVVWFRLGRYHEAATELQRAADLMPGSVSPYANLAVLHASLRQWNRALEFARLAQERGPYDVQALRVLARSLYAAGEDVEATQRALRELAKRDPSSHWRNWAVEQALQLKDRQGVMN